MTTSIELVLYSDDPGMIELLKGYKKMGLKEQYEMQVALHQFEANRLMRAIGRMESGPHRGGGNNRKAKADAQADH